METFIKIIINTSLIFESGYCFKEFLFNTEGITTKRIQRGLLSSEKLARKFTNTKLSF